METTKEIGKVKARGPRYRDTNLQIIFGISLMAVLGVTSITPAFPKIVEELNIMPIEVGLLITVFTFPMIIFALFLGVLGDRFGRKKIIIASLALFGVAGGACSLARDFNLLLILRFFQGIGSASLFPLGATIIGDIYSDKERTAAMGYNISVLYLGSAIFPAVGGAMAIFGWNYPFLLSLLALPIGLMALFFLKNPEPRGDQHIKEYLKNIWGDIKNRQVFGLYVFSIAIFIIFYGSYLTYFPLLVGNSFGATSIIIGIIIAGTGIIASLTSSSLGRLAKVISKGNLIKAGFVLYALALITIPLVSDIWLFIIPSVVFGVAHGVTLPSIETLMVGLGSMENRGAFMSVHEIVVRLGQTLGPIVMGVIFSIFGMASIFYAGALLSIAMLAFTFITK